MENFPLRNTLNDGGSNMPPFIRQLPLLSYGTWMFLQSPGHSAFWDGFFPVSHIQAVPLCTEWLTGTVKAGWIPPSLLKCSDTQSAGAASSHGALSCFTARSISTRDWEARPHGSPRTLGLQCTSWPQTPTWHPAAGHSIGAAFSLVSLTPCCSASVFWLFKNNSWVSQQWQMVGKCSALFAAWSLLHLFCHVPCSSYT